MSGFSIDVLLDQRTEQSSSSHMRDASFAVRSPVMDPLATAAAASSGTAVDCFEVDANTAALTELGVSATNGKSSIALALDEPDNFLYVLDNLANQIRVFSINTSSGALTLINGSPFSVFAGKAGAENLGPNAIAVQH